MKSYSKDSMAESVARRREHGDQLFEKWSNTDIGVKLDKLYEKNAWQARNVATLLENQERYLKTLTETQISSAFSTKPENVLKVVRLGTANSNLANIFTEITLSTTDDAFYFVDTVWADTKRDATAGAKTYESVSPDYPSQWDYKNLGTGDASTTVFGTDSGDIPATARPVVPNHVRVTMGGATVAEDDGSGNLVNVDGGSTITEGAGSAVDYTTGDVTVTFAAAPAIGKLVDIYWQWTSEDATLYAQYGKIELAVRKKRFDAQIHPLGYSFSSMVDLVLGTHGLGDVEDMLVRRIGEEHAKARDFRAIRIARQEALKRNVITFNTDFAAAGEISDKSHAQKVLSYIKDVGGAIYNSTQRGVINKIVCGSAALTYLQKHDLWRDDMTQQRVGGTYKAGYLSDIEVYVVVAHAKTLGDTECLLTFKNEIESGDVSIAFGKLVELNAALEYPQFYKEGNFATVEDHITIEPQFCRLMNLTNLPSIS